MAERDESRPTALRPLELHRPQTDDPTSRLRAALEVVDAKLRVGEGVDGIADWLSEAERIVADTSDAELEGTRREIRELIEKLLDLNAQVQNIARLKRLLA